MTRLTIIDAEPQDFLTLSDEAWDFLRKYAPRTRYYSVLTTIDRLDGRVLGVELWGDKKHVRAKVMWTRSKE